MELTIDEAMQQGVAAHKEGKLQDAERLYRAILQSQPAHPDANHNLGVLAVSVNKADAALPLFKTALEANPKIEQFWLSYIDALIREKQFDHAKQVIEQAKEQSFSREKLKVLEVQLFSRTQIESANRVGPSKQQQTRLLEYYQTGWFDDAEKLANSLIKQFPFHNFSWKILAALLRKTNRASEAEFAGIKTVEIAPYDAEAHNNLGITLTELGKLNEAAASYRQAIFVKHDYAAAHNNLGNTYKALGRSNEAEVSYSQAITLKYDDAEAYTNLGDTLKEAGRLDEAEANYKQSIALKPDFTKAYNNLGDTVKELGRLSEAEANYRRGISLKPDFDDAHNRLLSCLYLMDKPALFFDELDYLIRQDKANAVIGSLTYRSALKYGIEKPNPFCREPMNYVLHIDLNTDYNFKEFFVDKVRSVLKGHRISNRSQSLLINGHQTSGNFFDIKNGFTEEIQTAIRLEIEKYRNKYNNSDEGLIRKWPTEYSLDGWLISMKSGGELKPHIHEQGWVSGSVYINVPPKLKANSGNLVLSLGVQEDTSDARRNVEKIIDINTGHMVLFPGSLTHYTIPFEAGEDRIVLAFDVNPK
jgi:tetratricopeptide (TPR) repeat protein